MVLFDVIDWATILSQTMWILKGIGLLILILVIVGVIFLVTQYNFPILIYDNGVWVKDKAKKVRKGMISTFELKSSFFKPKQNKEVFMVPHNLIHKSKRGKLIIVQKMADGIYYPISNKIGELQLDIIPQDLDWLLERTRKIGEKYNEKKWYEHPLVMPTVFMVVAIIQFIIIMTVMDKVQGFSGTVSGACKEAEKNILDTVRQKITP